MATVLELWGLEFLVKKFAYLQQRISATLNRRKVMFSSFCRAVLPLFMLSLRRIQNLARFGRSGVGNVSPVTIFGIFAEVGATCLGNARPYKGAV
jgi:hypothetical protein